MKNPFSFPVKLTAVSDSMNSLHDFIKTSYKEQKEMIEESVAFFKDLAQMDEDFRKEIKQNEFCICLEGEMLTEKDVLTRPMEENY